MSGFEVAGVVLGSIPIVVEVLKLYAEGVSTVQKWRYYSRELKNLIRNLETEQVKLQNVLEKLLVGIAPPMSIEAMIDNPFGMLWKDEAIHQRVRLRLWKSYNVFAATVDDLRDAVGEIKAKLNVGPEGKVQWVEGASFRREFKRVSFVLQRSNYQELLSRIRDGVSNLERLTAMNVDLEPERRRRSHGRLYTLLRELSGSIYRALSSAISCTCPKLHDVALQLTANPVAVLPQEDDDSIVQELRFHIAMSYHRVVSSSTSEEHLGHLFWDELVIQLIREPASAPAPCVPSLKPRVKFALPAPTSTMPAEAVSASSVVLHATQASIALGTLWTPSIDGRAQAIQDLCQAVRRSQKQRSGGCCGNITDVGAEKRRTYGIYPLGCLNETGDWSLISLHDILTNGAGTTTTTALRYGDKLRLARVVASSVLQLHGTPWISAAPTARDIFVVCRDGMPLYHNAFVLKHLPERPRATGRCEFGTSRSMMLPALGILLVELMLGQTIESLRLELQEASGPPTEPLGWEAVQLANCSTAMRLLYKVNMLGGVNYESATRHCFRCDVYRENEGIEAWERQACVAVVALLEQDLRTAMA